MQRNLLKLREEDEGPVVEGAAGGLVTAFTNGNGELVKITLKRAVTRPTRCRT
jgi:DNA-binding protein YbaB